MNGASSLLSPPSRLDYLHTVTWATLALMLWVALGLFLWTLRPLDPVTRLELTVIGTPAPGGDLRILVDYCKTEGFTPDAVRWSLVDGVTIILPPLIVTLQPGCHVTLLVMPTARQMVAGTYRLRVDGVYLTYPWREPIVETAISNAFTVGP